MDATDDAAGDGWKFTWYEPDLTGPDRADPQATTENLCPRLQLLLSLYAGVLTRSEEGVRQGLRLATTTLGDEETQGLAEMLVNLSDPVSRFWLSRLDGPRRRSGKAFW